VYSTADDIGGAVPNDAVGHPNTFYGVHKQACEGMARIFWAEEQVPSIGIRPWIVYGPGRDHGLTASPTHAMAAAAAGDDYRITFGGRTQLQYAPDTARVFIAAARAATEDARVFHLGGPVVSLTEVAAAIEAVARRLDHGRRRHRPAVPGGVRRRPARRGARRHRLDAARRRRQCDCRAAARRAGVIDESTAKSAVARPTSTQSTTPKPLLASRIAPSTSGETADSV
jgi:nucleoside-diphosphate-sugar epimerase